MEQFHNPKQESMKLQYKAKQLQLNPKGILQFVFFTWVSDVIKFGSKLIHEQDTIPSLSDNMKSRVEYQKFVTELNKRKQNKENRKEGTRIFISVFLTFKKYLYISLLFGAISCVMSLTSPIITKMAINYIQQPEKQLSKSLFLIAIILITKFIGNLCNSHVFFNIAIFGFNLGNTLSLAIYAKALKFQNMCQKKYPISEIINYNQVDAQRMTMIGHTTAIVLLFPFVLIFGIYLMYRFIGISFLTGIGVIILLGVFVLVISIFQKKVNEQLLKTKDKRMKITNQIFNLIRFIKTNAWEKYFFNKLNHQRDQQLKLIKKNSLLGVITILVYWLSTPLILASTFAVFIKLGFTLTAEKAFTTIILFNILQFPIQALPQSIVILIQIWVSLKRVQKFLYTDQINNDYIFYKKQAEHAIQIQDGNFYWDLEEKKQQNKSKDEKNKQKQQNKQNNINFSTSQEEIQYENKKSLLQSTVDLQEDLIIKTPHINALKRINMSIPKDKFTIILGDIGSGKSSLFYSILGEIKVHPKYNSKVTVNGTIALVTQKPWIISASIENNIVMMNEFDQSRLQEAIKYSCLTQDLEILPNGIKTMIGQKGINLSGGQKARINLARAIYSNRDILLLDDIISAVDAHVGKFIVKQTIMCYLENKTRVLITHSSHFSELADYIIIMKNGEIVQRGTYNQIKQKTSFKQIQKQEISNNKEEQEEDLDGDYQKNLKENKSKIIQIVNKEQSEKKVKVIDKFVQELLLAEDRKRGEIPWSTYKNYIDLNGGILFIFSVTFFMVVWMLLNIFYNIQIERWCQHPQDQYNDLWIFTILAISSAFFAFFRALTLVFSGIRQGKVAHQKMIRGLMYASIPKFFDRIPIGRILNRVSKDLRELDQQIGYAIGNAYVDFFLLLTRLAICAYASTPYIIFPILLFLTICFFYKNYYMKTQRQCIRLENISNSPIVSSFAETINGLPTVRAYGLSNSFLQKQYNLIDINKRNRVCKEALQNWFTQRLSWISYMINIPAISYVLFNSDSNPSMAGLLLAYSFAIDQCIINLIYSLAYLQMKMVSIQRVTNFMNIEAQSGYLQYVKDWKKQDQKFEKIITNGKVEFKNLSIRYRQGLPFVLKNLNFIIQPKQKIGVVGRTGAGKSTITSSILRLIQSTEGSILIDDQNISQVNLKDLRSNITLIPQDPVLIEGTLRDNIDPTNQHTDEKLILTLKKCCIEKLLKDREGLQTKISDSGENLSVGEKQLICIARAILRETKLILVDEATANIDNKSDNIIQQTIKESFKDSTVITIAHRLRTIINSDRIIVLSNGNIVQFDTPQKLLEGKGLFYEMYQQSKNKEFNI